MNLEIIACKPEYEVWEFDHEHLNTIAEPFNPGLKNIQTNYFNSFHKYLKDKKNGNENISRVS